MSGKLERYIVTTCPGRVTSPGRVEIRPAVWDRERQRIVASWTADEPTETAVAHAAELNRAARPRPDFDPHLDYPERYSDGPV